MSFVLHFSGPSTFTQTVALRPGGKPVVVGRDPEAAVYLPDTERLVSRRHLSIEWSEPGALLKVLSPNGINTDHGDYFSGDEVVLADGESARIGSFSVIVSAAPEEGDLDATSFAGMGTRPVPTGPVTRAAAPDDPLAALASEWAPPPPPPPRHVPDPMGLSDDAMSFNLDDPFAASASWRVDEGAGDAAAPMDNGAVTAPLAGHPPPPPPRPAAQPGSAPTPERYALQSLCRGLGVDTPNVLTSFDWERLGQSMRHAIQCLSDHLAARQDFKKENRAEDRTMMGARENNPLKAPMPVKDLVNYLLFMPEEAPGFVPANRALQEVAQESRSHDAALRAAAKGLAEGALREFEPGKLRGVLLKGRVSMTSLVDNARLWDLYTSHYEAKAAKLPEWANELFNRYYMAAYLRDIEKMRRSRTPPPPARTE